MNTNFKPVARAALAACLLLGSLGLAQAATSDTPPAVTVSYGDLDLSTAAGAKALYERLASAARMVCPGEFSPDLKQVAGYYTCRREAIARAVSRINSSQLAALVANHSKHG